MTHTEIHKGAVQCLTLEHKTDRTLDYTFINTYLSASSKETWKDEVTSIGNFPPTSKTVMVGDFNHTTAAGDRSGLHADHTLASAELFQNMLNKHKMEEVHQPCHTWYGKRSDGIASSRIDHVYHNFTSFELTAITPAASLLSSIPFTLGQYIDRGRESHHAPDDNSDVSPILIKKIKSKAEGGNQVTDHLPLCVRFKNTGGNTKPQLGSLMNNFAIKHPNFLSNVKEIWENNILPASVWERLLYFKLTLIKVSKELQNTPQCNDSNNTLWQAIKLAHEIQDPNKRPDEEIIDCYSHLPDYIHLIDRPKDLIDKINLEFAANSIDQDKGNGLSRIAVIGASLPKSTTSIIHLKDDDSITDDPERMTKVIENFWGKKWNWKGIKNPDHLFDCYNKSITIQPTEITIDFIINTINDTGDTAPGPDTISFAAYRATKDIAGQVLLDCIKAMERGDSPPHGFNAGLLHLIPKKPTENIEDTRPLVINNTDNRIISDTICKSITPSTESILSDHQNGFRKGRSVRSNLTFFNEKFYSSFEKGNFYDILFIDFCKAFDSIAHEAIFKLLKKVGFNDGYVNMIKALFDDAFCYTNVKGAKRRIIKFKAGVKQGCPLSPTLFILVVDVLIDMVENTIDIDIKFYADDGALGSQDITKQLPQLISIFKTFRDYTGLEMNPSKTVCIATGGRTYLREALDRAGLDAIEIVGSARYLGLYLGHESTLNDNLTTAYEKLEKRTKLYLPHKHKYSYDKRITIWNVWLFPIFSFVCDYFLIPDDYIKSINDCLRAWLSSGNRIKPLHSCRPKNLYGFASPARDMRSYNIARLATLWEGKKAGRFSPKWTVRISTQLHLGWIAVHDYYRIHDIPNNSSSKLYALMMNSTYIKNDHLTYLYTKFDNIDIGEDGCRQAIANFNTLPNWLPSYIRSTCIMLSHNALPTARRLHTQHACYLCKESEDDKQHIYAECEATLTACANLNIKLNKNVFTPSIANFVGARKVCNGEINALWCMQTDSIWRARCLARSGYRKTTDQWSNWIVDNTLKRLHKACPSYFCNNFTSADLPVIYRINTRPSLGSSRRKADIVGAPNYATTSFLNKLPPNTLIAFTDGSAKPNPGPAGAGIFIYSNLPDHVEDSISISIGLGTNNTAELCAIAGAIAYGNDHHDDHASINILTDSKITKNALVLGHSLGTANEKILIYTRGLIRTSRIPVRISWIPGHSGIEGNDTADRLADEAASASNHSPELYNGVLDRIPHNGISHFFNNSSHLNDSHSIT